MSHPVVLVDTREQLPYAFPEGWGTMAATLPTGDYSVLGHEGRFAIERKSLNDLLGCIFQDRFEREIQRLAEFEHKYLIIEANIWKIQNARFYRGEPKAVIGKLQVLQLRYGVAVLYLDDRETAQSYAHGLLSKYWKHVLKSSQEKGK